jgi:hypothetical protein
LKGKRNAMHELYVPERVEPPGQGEGCRTLGDIVWCPRDLFRVWRAQASLPMIFEVGALVAAFS